MKSQSSRMRLLRSTQRKRVGSKLWPACNARTKGNPKRGRAPGRCRAAGCGFHNKCKFHGGLSGGSPLGVPRNGQRPVRRFVLFSESNVEDAFLEKRMQRRWHMSALPFDLFERLPPGTLEAGIDVGYLQVLMEKNGVPRRVAEKWPKQVGFPIVQLLAERGRIELAIFSDRRGIMRATRQRAPLVTDAPVTVTGAELLQALHAAGERPPKPRASRETRQSSLA